MEGAEVTAFNYQEYLASREWALLREAVRERSGDKCERCGGPQQAVHHLTYERIGHEELTDLQAVCNPCHEYLSAKTDIDPTDPSGRELGEVEWAFIWGLVVGAHDADSLPPDDDKRAFSLWWQLRYMTYEAHWQQCMAEGKRA
jgi:hypothetical protein